MRTWRLLCGFLFFVSCTRQQPRLDSITVGKILYKILHSLNCLHRKLQQSFCRQLFCVLAVLFEPFFEKFFFVKKFFCFVFFARDRGFRVNLSVAKMIIVYVFI